MNKKIRSIMILAFAIAIIGFVFNLNYVFAVDFASIVKDAEAKYSKFNNNVKDMTLVQEMTMSGMPMQMKMFMKDKKFRAETTMNMPKSTNTGQEMPAGMQTTIIYDGNDTWMISPLMGKSKLPKGQEKQYENKSNWWALISDKAEITGSEKVNNIDCYVIEAKEKGSYPFNKIWIDKNKLLMIKAENNMQNGKTMSFVFSDFKEIKNGWEMPYKTDMLMDGKLMSTTTLKSIDLNKGISDDLFDASKVEAKEVNMQDIMKQMMQQQQGNVPKQK